MKGKEVLSLDYMGLTLLYDISPVDMVPDMPVIGWLDTLTSKMSRMICLYAANEQSRIVPPKKNHKNNIYNLHCVKILLNPSIFTI